MLWMSQYWTRNYKTAEADVCQHLQSQNIVSRTLLYITSERVTVTRYFALVPFSRSLLLFDLIIF